MNGQWNEGICNYLESSPIFRQGRGDNTGRKLKHERGYLEYRYAPGDTCELVDIAVDSEYRDQGIGSSLIRQAEQLPNVKTLYGFTRKENDAVQRLYVRLGFLLVPIPNFYGKGFDAVMVIKNLETDEDWEKLLGAK